MTSSPRTLKTVIVTPTYGTDYQFQTIPEAVEFLTTHKQDHESETLKFLQYHVALYYQDSTRVLNGWHPDNDDAIAFLEALDKSYHR